MITEEKDLIDVLKHLGVAHVFSLSNDLLVDIIFKFEQADFAIHTLLSEESLPIFAGTFAFYSNTVSVVLASEGFFLNKMLNSIISARIRYFPILFVIIKDKSFENNSSNLSSNNDDLLLTYLQGFDVQGISLTGVHNTSQINQFFTYVQSKRKPGLILLNSETLEISSRSSASTQINITNINQIDSCFVPSALDLEPYQNTSNSIAIIGNGINQLKNFCSVRDFIEKLKIPFMTLPSSKSSLFEQSPLFLGVYYGKFSPLRVKKALSRSTALLTIGLEEHPYDLFETDIFEFNITKWPSGQRLNLSCSSIQSLNLSEADSSVQQERSAKLKVSNSFDKGNLLHTIPLIFSEKELSPKIIISDVGVVCLCSLEIQLHDRDLFMSHHASASMGHALATGLGASLAHPDVPVWILVGDGSLLMSLNDLSDVGASSSNINVLLLDNNQYLTENMRRQSILHSTPSVNWEALAGSLGFSFFRDASRPQELHDAIVSSKAITGPSFVHIKLEDGNLPLNVQSSFMPAFMQS